MRDAGVPDSAGFRRCFEQRGGGGRDGADYRISVIRQASAVAVDRGMRIVAQEFGNARTNLLREEEAAPASVPPSVPGRSSSKRPGISISKCWATSTGSGNPWERECSIPARHQNSLEESPFRK